MHIHDQSYSRVIKEVQAANAEAERFIGPCRECKFYVCWDSDWGNYSYCKNPLVQSHFFSEETGRMETKNMVAKDARANICGNKGGLFQRHWWPFYNRSNKFSFWVMVALLVMIFSTLTIKIAQDIIA